MHSLYVLYVMYGLHKPSINLKISSSIISYFETNDVMMIYALHSQGVWGISTDSIFLINNRNGSSSVSHYEAKFYRL